MNGQFEAVRHERLEVRLVDCGNFRLREHRRRRDEAVESRTAAATGFIEKVGGVGGSGLYSAISRFARRLRRINAETQRFAEERRERRKKMLFSSAFLRALCVSASLRLCVSALNTIVRPYQRIYRTICASLEACPCF
jgi:hypothetical protein